MVWRDVFHADVCFYEILLIELTLILELQVPLFYRYTHFCRSLGLRGKVIENVRLKKQSE